MQTWFTEWKHKRHKCIEKYVKKFGGTLHEMAGHAHSHNTAEVIKTHTVFNYSRSTSQHASQLDASSLEIISGIPRIGF